MQSHKSATSITIIADILNKTNPMVPKMSMPTCDVRDVARAHIQVI